MLLIILTVVLVVLDVSEPPIAFYGRRLSLIQLIEVSLRLEHLDLDLFNDRTIHCPNRIEGRVL